MIKDLFELYSYFSDLKNKNINKGIRSIKSKKIRFIFIYVPIILITLPILFNVYYKLVQRVESKKAKKAFDEKYKTVVKVNAFGFKSYEYHER